MSGLFELFLRISSIRPRIYNVHKDAQELKNNNAMGNLVG